MLLWMIRPDDIHIVPTKGADARILARQFKSENAHDPTPSGQIVHSSESSLSIYQVGTAIAPRVVATHTVLFPQPTWLSAGWRDIGDSLPATPDRTRRRRTSATMLRASPAITVEEQRMDVLKNAVEYGIIGLLIALSVVESRSPVERWLYYRRVNLAQFTDVQTLKWR